MPSEAPSHRFWRMLDNSRQNQTGWRRENQQHFEYYDGDQWSSEELEELEERGQQATVLNIIRPTIDMMFAQYLERRGDLILIGREISDDGKGEVLSHLLKFIFDKSDYDYYEGEVFTDGATGGMGWFGVDVGEDEFGDTTIEIDQIPWEEMYWDPHARKPLLQDARHMHRVVWMDIDVVEAEWPDAEISYAEATAGWDDYIGQEAKAQEASDPINGDMEHRQRRVPVVETWYRDAKGELRQVIWTGSQFLSGGPEDSDNSNPHNTDEEPGFNLFPFIPYRFSKDSDGLPQGVPRWMKTQQDSLNHLHSKWQHNMSSRQIFAEEGAIEDIEEVREEINKSDGVVMLNAGALTEKRVMVQDNVREGAHLMEMMKFMLIMGQRVSGVNDATMGIGGVNSRSNQQEQSRILQGAQMQSRGLTNLFMTKRQVAKVALRLAALHMKQPMIIRLIEPNGEHQVFPLNQTYQGEDSDGNTIEQEYKVADALQYDVIMKTVPAFDSIRQHQMLLMAEVAKSGVMPPQIANRIIIELSSLPDKQRLLQELEQFEQMQQQALMAQQAGALQ